MIIAAYAGCGKSYWANNISGSVDIPSMPYARILPTTYSSAESEKEKAAFYHVSNPLYPFNYIKEILLSESEYDYVIIPSAFNVIEELSKTFKKDVVVAYPDISLKDEYRQRYIKRGNSNDFMRVFIENWDEMIEALANMNDCKKIVLNSGEYLSDVKPRIDELGKSPHSSDKLCKKGNSYENDIYEIDKILNEINTDMYLWVPYLDKEYVCHVDDIESEHMRNAIYEFAKYLYMKNEAHALYNGSMN